MDEINFETADFAEISRFAKNLLGLQRSNLPQNYDAQIAYISTTTQVLIARRTAASAEKLAFEIDQARSGVARGLEKLGLVLADASTVSEREARRMVKATWGLVIVTGLLALVTAGLVFYTRQLVLTEATVVTVQPAPKVGP